MLTGTIAVILVLGGLIFFHELGHFLVARSLGIGVRVFSLGFGPRLFGLKSGKTEYRLSAVPLGGFVSLAGELEPTDESGEFSREELFLARPPWQRMLVVLAGPVCNVLLAWCITWGLLLVHGETGLAPRIGAVVKESPAEAAGLKPGDEILAVDGQAVRFFSDLVQFVQGGGGQPLAVSVRRGSGVLDVAVRPAFQVGRTLFGEEVRVPMIGIAASQEVVALPVDGASSLVAATRVTWNLLRLTVQGLIKLIERVIPLESIGGPIMIAQLVGSQARSGGLSDVLSLTALISVNLGVLNLLPIPVLDGGHILGFGIEMLRGRPLSERVRRAATGFGVAFLLALLGLATYNDISRLLK
jgi:regulator of sigma E protease